MIQENHKKNTTSAGVVMLKMVSKWVGGWWVGTWSVACL